MAQLAGFKESGMRKIADRMGYTGSMTGFQAYLQENPDKQQMMNSYVNKAMLMASGGYVRKFQEGGVNPSPDQFKLPEGFDEQTYLASNPDVGQAIGRGEFTSAADHFKKFGGGENRFGSVGVPQQFLQTQGGTTTPNIPGVRADQGINVGAAVSYIQANPDLVQDALSKGIDVTPGGRANNREVIDYALRHYLSTGYKEGRPLGVGQEAQPVFDARDIVRPPPAEGTSTPASGHGSREGPPPPAGEGTTTQPIQPDPDRTFATFQDLQNAPRESLTPEQVHILNFYSNTPEQQQAINAMPEFRNAQLPVGQYQPGVRVTAPDAGAGTDTQPPVGPVTDPSPSLQADITAFENLSDRQVEDYLFQNPDLFDAFGGDVARAKQHFREFGAREIREGARPNRIAGLTPNQLQVYRFANPDLANLNDMDLRRQYLTRGFNEIQSGTRATNINSRILTDEEASIYLENNPDLIGMSLEQAKQHFIRFGNDEMLTGKREKIEQLVPPTSPYSGLTSIGDISAARMERPAFPSGTRVTPEGIPIREGTDVATTTGQVTGDRTASPATAAASTGATATPEGTVGQVTDTTKTATGVQTVTDATTGKTMSLTKPKPVAAQQTTSAVTGQAAETGKGIQIDPATQVQRAAITEAETVTPVAKASDASAFIEEIKAQTTDPTKFATVAGQLENLLTDFDASNPPSWAAGAMRAATAELARRGMGASSIAGQAIVQAAMESALPIAQADAQIQAQFEAQNLSNRQQMALFYGQQRAAFMGQEFDQAFQARVTNAARVADIADKNFTAQQQVQLENSNIVNTMNLNNLSNRQAVQMAEIAALAQLDMANLNNRQQAAVQEAQAFLQKDLTDVSNAQQTTLFNAQQRIQSMFTDAAADNARKQFNATSDNQSNQFFANLATQTSQFNDAQKNAINQFNAGQANTINRFNAELNNQRDQFNAQNRLVIDQSNAQWRRAIATADTAATNRANELNAEALLDISNTAYNDLWQYYSDAMEFAWTSAENERTRTVNLAIEQLRADSNINIAELKNDYASSVGFGNLIGTFLTAPSSSAAGGFLSSFGSGVSSVVETGVEALLGFS